MATIGHHCTRTGRWEVLGAADVDAFRVRKDGRDYEFKAPYGTVTVSCRCGYSEDVPLREAAPSAQLMQNGTT